MKLDPDLLGRVLTRWRGAFGDRPATVREAVSCAELCDLMREVGPTNPARGLWVKRHQGRTVGGLRFALAGVRGTALYVVEPDAPTLLREAAAAGVVVRLSDGTLMAGGEPHALARMLPQLRQHYDELLRFLTATRETAAALTAAAILGHVMRDTR